VEVGVPADPGLKPGVTVRLRRGDRPFYVGVTVCLCRGDRLFAPAVSRSISPVAARAAVPTRTVVPARAP